MRSKNKGLWQKLSEEFVWLDSKYSHPPYHNRLIKEIFPPVLNKGGKYTRSDKKVGTIRKELGK